MNIVLRQEANKITIVNGSKEVLFADEKSAWGEALLLATMKVLLARIKRNGEEVNLIIDLNGGKVLFKANSKA